MRRVAASCAFVLLALVACSDASVEPGPEAPTPATSSPAAPGSIPVSDEVPSMQELREIGLTDQQAECFVREIDPDSTGRVQDADLLMTAMANCL